MTRVALENVPSPPVHCPAPLAVALNVTAAAPQTAYGPAASAVAVPMTLKGWFTVIAGQGPVVPSGSVVVQTNTRLELPTSEVPGV